MGAIFSIWDRLFGTLSKSTDIQQITFGLNEKDNRELNVFYKSVFIPFIGFFKKLFRLK